MLTCVCHVAICLSGDAMKQSPATHTPATVKALITEIDASMQAARALSEVMESRAMESVRISAGQAEVLRAKKAIMKFGQYLKRAIEEAREERGDYGIREPAGNEKPAPKRSKKKSGS